MTLLLSALLLLQDPAAEETYRKIETAVEKAKSMKVTFTLELTEKRKSGAETFSASGELLIKEGNKLFTRATVARPDQKKETVMISDGTRMLTRRNDLPFGEAQAPSPALSARTAGGFLRGGLYSFDRYLYHRRADQPIGPAETDIRKILDVSDFKAGPDDGDARTLTFRCTAVAREESDEVTLTYDPKTFRLLKRAIKPSDKSPFSRVVETYGDFVLDGEIPDHAFKLPEEK